MADGTNQYGGCEWYDVPYGGSKWQRFLKSGHALLPTHKLVSNIIIMHTEDVCV